MPSEATTATPPASRPESACFQTTCWSEIRRAADTTLPEAREALASICAAYWYPVYAYLRGCSIPAEDAQDLTQAFFERVVEKGILASADERRGRFRWFLLVALQNFFRNELSRARTLKRGGGVQIISWDALEAEQRFNAEPAQVNSPDELFDRTWAQTALDRALARLKTEFSSNGRAAVFEHLKGCLEGSVVTPGYQTLATQLGLSPAAIKVSVHRLRERFRELVRQEVALTVSDPAEVDDELRHLVRLVIR